MKEIPKQQEIYLNDLVEKAQTTKHWSELVVYERKFSERLHSLISQGYNVRGYYDKYLDTFLKP